MMPLIRILVVALVMVGGAFNGTAIAQQPPPEQQDEFVPIDQLPPDEKLPAARLLIAAYAVAWVGIAAYLWSIWQRLGRVEREMAEVSRRLQQTNPPGANARGGGAGR
jgi:CcmD family protein